MTNRLGAFFLPAACAAALPLLSGCAGISPLHQAAQAGDVGRIQALLAQGVDVNVHDIAYQTPLTYAICPCRPEVVRVLLAAGADVNVRDTVNGRSPLDLARICKAGDCAAVEKQLIAAGASTSGPIAPAGGFGGFGGMLGPGPAVASSIPDSMHAGTGAAAQAAAPKPGATADDSRTDAPPAPVESDVDTPGYSVAPDESKFAVVIGIAKYRDIPEAEFADNDAKAVKRHLLALGYPEENIITLIGDRATKSTLEDKLERWLPMNTDSRSTVFVYYSGHGAPDPGSGNAYLVPWDGDPGSLEDTAFSLARFYKDLNKLPAKRVLVALDACFSGAGGRSVLAKGARPLVTKVVSGFPGGEKLVGLTASGADQISGTLESQGHGAFTYYLLKGLNGAAGRGDHVTMGDLYDYVSRKVSAAAHRQEREQTPQLLPLQDDSRTIVLR